MSAAFGLNETEIEYRLGIIQELVAKPITSKDNDPGMVAENLWVGSKHHAAQVDKLVELGITAVLNCASSGVSTVPLDKYRQHGIRYGFTNVKRDDSTYPILHDEDGVRSPHLDDAKGFYEEVVKEGGKALFFCVAGQNRSATLAVAVCVLGGMSLQKVLLTCAKSRPFILENEGFQRQLIELESMVLRGTFEAHSGNNGNGNANGSNGQHHLGGKKRWLPSGHQIIEQPSRGKRSRIVRKGSSDLSLSGDIGNKVEVELRVPGLVCFDVGIPVEGSVDDVKKILTERVNRNLKEEYSARVGKAWLVFSMFGCGIEFGLVLEEEAVDASVQIARLHNTYGLDILENPSDARHNMVAWTDKCRFEMIIFSIVKLDDDTQAHRPFTFRHQERKGVPGTYLANNTIEVHLRAWDFVSGEGFRSKGPIAFSYAEDARNKRDFRDVATDPAEEQRVYTSPEESSILGMGANAIVHRVQLQVATPSPEGSEEEREWARGLSRDVTLPHDSEWDAAVKRPFTVVKMLSAMGKKSEAGMARRLRMAAALNRHERLLYFYGLGIALASNCDDREEFKFELVLLSRYQEHFSTYTMKKFLDDYITVLHGDEEQTPRMLAVKKLQDDFSLIKVKVLLVSLLNGFRDLTLMGIQAYDFNHLDNVLISRDYRKARLIDIDGQSKGSIQFPSSYFDGCENASKADSFTLHKPALDVDLSVLLPLVVQHLLLGKGKGKTFVSDQVSKIWRSDDVKAKELIKCTIRDHFFGEPRRCQGDATAEKHLCKVTEWLFAVLKKRDPWANWTNDIYDAMRCIDHLPIT
mmetsp:Transcript_83958/g.175618  ORF Transcript_83958/g.175618 Transcript_83958/m.175618 type:complete len:807 (-) Transcript_83958:264-2684(-)